MRTGLCECGQDPAAYPLPDRTLITHDEHWVAEHAWGSRLLGWLILSPRRPVRELFELTECEASRLGTWQLRLAQVLKQELGTPKVYVAEFGEVDGYNLHFHVVARPNDLQPDLRGFRVFNLLGGDAASSPSAADRDALAAKLRGRLASIDDSRVLQGRARY